MPWKRRTCTPRPEFRRTVADDRNLILAFRHRAYQLARRRLNSHDADDVAQGTMLRLLKRRAARPSPQALATKIAHDLLCDHLRRVERAHGPLDRVEDLVATRNEEAAVSESRRSALYLALDRVLHALTPVELRVVHALRAASTNDALAALAGIKTRHVPRNLRAIAGKVRKSLGGETD